MLCFQVCERKRISEMVKNKNIGGCRVRSSACKKKRAGPRTVSNRDLALLDYPADSDIPAVSQELQTTGQGQLGFPDRVYLLASVIFQNNHLKKPAAHRLVSYGKQRGLPLPEVKGEEMQRSAYELAFSTLKCECVSLLVPSYVSSYLFSFSLAHFFSIDQGCISPILRVDIIWTVFQKSC